MRSMKIVLPCAAMILVVASLLVGQTQGPLKDPGATVARPRKNPDTNTGNEEELPKIPSKLKKDPAKTPSGDVAQFKSDVDIVTLGVESSASPARLMPHGIHLLKAGTVDALLGAERAVLVQADMPGDAALFGGAAGLVRSQALLRVSIGRAAPTGLLCIGARRAGRFHPGLGTELLSFLARVLGMTISQWLSPGR